MRPPRVIQLTAAMLLAMGSLGAVALAASPKEGARFKGTLLVSSSTTPAGTVSAPVEWGTFRAPISFTVSADGAGLRDFTYAERGCFGGGGVPITTDVFKLPGTQKTVGAMPVRRNGTFAASKRRSVYRLQSHEVDAVTTTVSSVTGEFTSKRTATGTITFSQSEVNEGHTYTCGPVSVTFSAKIP
jgi:hypothetical protein